MMEKKFTMFCLYISMIVLFGCRLAPTRTTVTAANNNQEIFWKELNALCGKAFEGVVVSTPANDTVFKDQRLVMHVRNCNKDVIRIPFMIGNNRSRTWVFKKLPASIILKHDHRHEDGKEDNITQYGGETANTGSSTIQVFPADEQTINVIPAALTNVWWVELVPGKHFTYNLRRVNTDRLFIIKFDITNPVAIPQAPWGWKD